MFQRLFEVPDMEPGPQIPFSRVNHNKYMVTDEVAYIGEFGSCWNHNHGVGLIVVLDVLGSTLIGATLHTVIFLRRNTVR